jgi:CheY-like chemotaxis protein
MNVSQLRVLVVDDVLLSRQAIAEALVRIGMSPDLAQDSKQALEQIRSAAAKSAPYDAIILDWKMDNVDGIELAAIIKQEFASNLPRIIMLSAFDIDALKILGQPLGIRDYLQKPVNSSSLLNCLLNVAQQTQPAMMFDAENEQEVPDFSHAHVLLVEDDELNQKVAKFFLADTKIKVSTAENGAVALQLLALPNNYDLVLMDMQMPVMDGLTATQKIRHELKLDIPIIAMTAHALPSEIEKSFAAGANGHLIKPIQAAQLYETLSIYLAK